ncbi:bacteriocin [Chryseobacterium sp. H1D6B]|uniref:bacteriocin n=1 Tax=Chryseobacterium sp. H1D6B TaxID=2940588 RepID=UPI0015C8C850|nr:bacteriocin [Chryseobacterium sp. H1D6B]
MKKSTFQKRKLSKKELKEISGGRKPICPRVVTCYVRETGEERSGVPGEQDGYCC